MPSNQPNSRQRGCERQRQLLHGLVRRITLAGDSLHIEIKRPGLNRLLLENRNEEMTDQNGVYCFSVHSELKCRGVEAKLVVRGPHGKTPVPDAKLVNLLARAYRWLDQLTEGKVKSVKEIAHGEGVNAGDVGRTIQLAFLAPDIVEAIVAGLQPIELTPRPLMRIGALPLAWDCQRCLLGFPQSI
jgi:hypothetical protein